MTIRKSTRLLVVLLAFCMALGLFTGCDKNRSATIDIASYSDAINDIPAEHMEMLKFYLSFCDRYRDVLLEGSLHVYQPEMLYSMAYAQKGNRAVAVDFSGVVWNIESGIDEAVYVNAAQKDALYINAENIDGTYDILNCRGKIIEKGTLLRNTLKKFNVPVSGMIIIRR